MANPAAPTPGCFCWFELRTTDQPSANQFYSELFGYSVTDVPLGPSDMYSMLKLSAGDVGAVAKMQPAQAAHGVPPHWAVYILVENAEAAAKRAADLGGTVLSPVFEVMEAGRMAIVKDPTGAVFQLWEAKNTGNGLAQGEGSVCWTDLLTPDAERATAFYRGLFGWKIAPGEHDASEYLHIQNEKKYIGGIPSRAQVPPGTTPHWSIYFQVANCDASVEKLKTLGGKIYSGPMTLEHVGRFAAVADPQGASFALFEPPEHS